MELDDDHMCFACGKDNEIGLHLDFKYEDKKTIAEWIPKKPYQGYKDIVHGGIIATVLDEAMTRLGFKLDLNTVTGHLEISFKKPAFVGKKYVIKAEITEEQDHKVYAAATLTDEEGTIISEGKGILVKVKSHPEKN